MLRLTNLVALHRKLSVQLTLLLQLLCWMALLQASGVQAALRQKAAWSLVLAMKEMDTLHLSWERSPSRLQHRGTTSWNNIMEDSKEQHSWNNIMEQHHGTISCISGTQKEKQRLHR